MHASREIESSLIHASDGGVNMAKSGEVVEVHINPELVFRRALVLANSRDDVIVEKVLSFPVGSIPTSLFHDDGTMRKSCNADRCHQLEAEVSCVHSLEPYD